MFSMRVMEHFSRFERQNHKPLLKRLEPVPQPWKRFLAGKCSRYRQIVDFSHSNDDDDVTWFLVPVYSVSLQRYYVA